MENDIKYLEDDDKFNNYFNYLKFLKIFLIVYYIDIAIYIIIESIQLFLERRE